MSSGNSNPFLPSTSRKEPLTPENPNPKIKQSRANFTSEIGTTICNSPSSTPKGRKKTPVTPPNSNPNLLSFVHGTLPHCRTDGNSDAVEKTQFPSDFVEEILLRLGVKSLLRFKSLSKQWFFLLSSQQFITRHLKIQTSIRTRQEFIIQNFKDMNFAIGTLDDNPDWICFRLLETNPFQPPDEIWDFLGYCNGLVSTHLYSKETNRKSIVVWNPSTMEQRRFPMPQCFATDTQVFGFGYDSVSDDYKLVVATKPVFARKLDKIQSLSLRTGLWKTAQCDAGYSFGLSLTDGKHLNGCIYWFIDRELRSRCGIASFDLSTDRLREEESLSWIPSNISHKVIRLELLGESLCLIVCPDEVTYDFWMMEENVVRRTKSWIKLFSVSISDPRNQVLMDPVCLIGNRKVLIYWYPRNEYALYDPDNQSGNKVAELGNLLSESQPVSPYVESLVSLG